MIKQWNRRREYRDAISTGYDPYTGRGAKRINSREIAKPENPDVIRLREEITEFISQRNLHAAAELYLELISIEGAPALPRQQLLDIANQLASEGRHDLAATAYEKFLAHYANYEYVEQVELMLGLILSRYLDKPDDAVKHLQAAEPKLTDTNQLKMCRDEIEKLSKR
jgi:outer membrane protein assembly factor BamD (BamD/ComL family)